MVICVGFGVPRLRGLAFAFGLKDSIATYTFRIPGNSQFLLLAFTTTSDSCVNFGRESAFLVTKTRNSLNSYNACIALRQVI